MENGLDYCCGKAVTKQLAAIKQACGSPTSCGLKMITGRVYVATWRDMSKGRR